MIQPQGVDDEDVVDGWVVVVVDGWAVVVVDRGALVVVVGATVVVVGAVVVVVVVDVEVVVVEEVVEVVAGCAPAGFVHQVPTPSTSTAAAARMPSEAWRPSLLVSMHAA